MILICRVILQDHVTKGWSNIMGKSPSWQVTIDTVVIEI